MFLFYIDNYNNSEIKYSEDFLFSFNGLFCYLCAYNYYFINNINMHDYIDYILY